MLRAGSSSRDMAGHSGSHEHDGVGLRVHVQSNFERMSSDWSEKEYLSSNERLSDPKTISDCF